MKKVSALVIMKCFGSIAAVAQKTADKTVTHNCMRDCECTVPRVPGDATRRLNDHISARLEPYDLEGIDVFPRISVRILHGQVRCTSCRGRSSCKEKE